MPFDFDADADTPPTAVEKSKQSLHVISHDKQSPRTPEARGRLRYTA